MAGPSLERAVDGGGHDPDGRAGAAHDQPHPALHRVDLFRIAAAALGEHGQDVTFLEPADRLANRADIPLALADGEGVEVSNEGGEESPDGALAFKQFA